MLGCRGNVAESLNRHVQTGQGSYQVAMGPYGDKGPKSGGGGMSVLSIPALATQPKWAQKPPEPSAWTGTDLA